MGAIQMTFYPASITAQCFDELLHSKGKYIKSDYLRQDLPAKRLKVKIY